jgi:hypothetical protein
MKLLSICLVLVTSKLFSGDFREEDFKKDFVEYIQNDFSYCLSRISMLPFRQEFSDEMSNKEKYWYYKGRLDLSNSIIFYWE